MSRWHLLATWWLYANRLARAERNKTPGYWHNHYGPTWDNADSTYRYCGARREL